jgi:starvation-inducible DNA-binding protein
MEARIGLSQENATAVSQMLQKILADEFVLYTKTRKAHWCVTGPGFLTKHKYFEELYLQLEVLIDEVAERIRILGLYPVASLQEFINLTSLTEHSLDDTKSVDFIKELLADHETIVKHLRGSIDMVIASFCDAGSGDFITQLMGKHEKIAWILRSQLDK